MNDDTVRTELTRLSEAIEKLNRERGEGRQLDTQTRSTLILFLAGMTGAMFAALLWQGANIPQELMGLVTMMAQGILGVLNVGVGFYFGRETADNERANRAAKSEA